MPPSRPFPAFARKPDWAREMRAPTAREWNQSVKDAKSTKNHCGKLLTSPTWVYLVLNPSCKGGRIDYDDLLEHMRFLPETPERWPPLPPEGLLPNETVPELLARFGMGEYSVAMIQLHAAMEQEEEERKLLAIADRTRPAAIANAPANSGASGSGAAPPPPRPPLRVETAAAGASVPQQPPHQAPMAAPMPALTAPRPKPPPPPPSGTGGLSCLPRMTPPTPQARPPTVDAATQTDEVVLERIGTPTWVRFRCPHTGKAYWWHNQSNKWWWADSKHSGWTKYRDPRTMQYFWACDASTPQWDDHRPGSGTDWFWDIGDDALP